METMLDWKQAQEGFWALLARGESSMCEEAGREEVECGKTGLRLDMSPRLQSHCQPLNSPDTRLDFPGGRREAGSGQGTPISDAPSGCQLLAVTIQAVVGQTELGSEPSTGKGIPRRRPPGRRTPAFWFASPGSRAPAGGRGGGE